MKKVSKIILVCLLITITLSTIIFLNKKEIKSNGMFAIMLEKEKGTGKYEYAKDNKWPQSDEYVINMYKTHCEKGSVLRWNNETKRINATVKGTDKCYVYFDLSEYGTEEHPYLIQTIEDLVRLSNEVNSGTTYAGKYFLLTTDLDFQDASDYEDASRTDFKDINGINGDEALITELATGSGFIPIGNSQTNSFQGIFDGNNKRIDNIFVNNLEKDSIGLFGYIKNSSITNLNISGNITSQVTANIGGISGTSYGNCILTNLHNNAKITNEANLSPNLMYIGGVIGYMYAGKTIIDNNSNQGSIVANSGYSVGGLIGFIDINVNLSINNSFNETKIEAYKASHIGGLFGYKKNDASDNNGLNNTYIKNCYNIGEIINYFNYKEGQFFCGGLAGVMAGTSNSFISNSYNTGKVYGCNRVGGIAGFIGDNVVLNQSYNKGEIASNENSPWETSGQKNCVGGLLGTTGKVHILNSYNSGNITSKYILDGNESYGQGSGLIGFAQSSVNVINSFNEGDVLGTAGLLWMGGGIVNPSNGNNIFNIGRVNENLRSRTATVSIWQNKSIFNAQNMYYWNESSSYTTTPEPNATPKTLLEMKSQTFVDELNKNVESINLGEIDDALKDYKLSKWILGNDGYPTLINE